ncbi:HNH endonuclease [Moraxella canis]|uniref:Putative HNH nuclease YajD n=1 Tax=Moraxella canis TaxID=90239 RepID=A0A1S9ZKM1_9GAMM|nr:HNH endonuclease [Moraxella canis]OOR83903.1 hypothetical protein B0180_05530 [Moraxella canis]
MPIAPSTLCKAAGCNAKAVAHGRCKLHQLKPGFPDAIVPKQRYKDKRPSASKRGYDSRWRHARLAFLDDNPLCVMCQANGLLVAATVVDHIIPHRGNQARFWDISNWQALCKTCHDHKTNTIDRKLTTALLPLANRDGGVSK